MNERATWDETPLPLATHSISKGDHTQTFRNFNLAGKEYKASVAGYALASAPPNRGINCSGHDRREDGSIALDPQD